jgi:hypothetical protein
MPKPRPLDPIVDPVFPYEATQLFHATRVLHVFAADLEKAAGGKRPFVQLTDAGRGAMLDVAGAGSAGTERKRAHQLALLREKLARFSRTIRGLADAGLVDDEELQGGILLVQRVAAEIDGFANELEPIVPRDRKGRPRLN